MSKQPMEITNSDIQEKVFLNDNYQIVSEEEATLVRFRLKNGNTFYGYPVREKPVKVVLNSKKDYQNAS